MHWYRNLIFYGIDNRDGINENNTDIKVLPSIIEKVFVPKITGELNVKDYIYLEAYCLRLGNNFLYLSSSFDIVKKTFKRYKKLNIAKYE